MSPTVVLIAEAVAAAFELTMDVLTKVGKVSAEDLEAAKALAIARIENYAASEAAQKAKEWRIVQGLEP
jgi:hypothetical protein